MEKTIYVVTHGEKFSGPNPGLTPKGIAEIAALRSSLPNNPTVIVCGVGRRHLDVAKALDLVPTRYTNIAGDPDSGKKGPDGKMQVVLADGTQVPSNIAYTSIEDNTPAAQALVKSLPDGAVICAGRPFMIMLGNKDAQSAQVYKMTIE
jgi:hypothetical protein